MSKYKNKRLHISFLDLISAIFVLVLLAVSAYFWSEYQDTKGKFNIGQTNVDFIISAPSREQVSEIQARNDVERIVPYVYQSIDISGNKKTVNSGLYIIENIDDLDYTVFSDALKVKTVSSSVTNPLYISSDLAKTADLSVNDKANTSISGMSIEFTVVGIYRSDYRNVGGTAIAPMQDDVKSLCGDSYKYTGAYVSSNDVSTTKSYLDSYIGMGDLRSADEFDSDDAYQQYLENRSNKNSSESTFSAADYLKELERRYNAQLLRDMLISLGFVLGCFIVILCDLLGRSASYTKSNVEKDIRDNFTLEQEKQMYARFHTSGFFMYLIMCVAYLAISYLIFNNDLLSINTISALVAIIICAIIARAFSIGGLNRQFSICAEKIRKENEDNARKENDNNG